MRILLVCEPGADGAFRHVEALIFHLLARKHAVAFAFSTKRGSHGQVRLLQSFEDGGGMGVDLLTANKPAPSDIFAFAKLLVLMRRFRPDIIHCHSSKAGVLGRLAAIFAGVPAVYTPHAYFGMGVRRTARTGLFNQIERWLAGIGQTINVSEDEALFARSHLSVKSSRQTVIPNAVDPHVFKPAQGDEKKRWRLAKGLPADALVIGTLGRLSYQKDPLTLYRAFEVFARHRPDVYLAHLGTGELFNDCEQWIRGSGLSERVLRTDYSPEPSEFYRMLDAFVLSSRYEGLAIAVLEALATNLPLVLTDVPGNRDFFKLGLTHLWTAPADNPVALAQAIGECVDSLGNGGPCNHRQIAVEKFSEEACFGRILDLYRELGQRKGTDCLFAPKV